MGRPSSSNRSRSSTRQNQPQKQPDVREPQYTPVPNAPSKSSASERTPLIQQNDFPPLNSDPSRSLPHNSHSAAQNNSTATTNAWSSPDSEFQSLPPEPISPSSTGLDTNHALSSPEAVDSNISPASNGSAIGNTTTNSSPSPNAGTYSIPLSDQSSPTMPSSAKCAVFWDFENCAPPTSVPGYVVVDSIRRAISHFGPIVQFRSYFEINENSNVNMRSELQSSGVSVIDTPHNARKDAADKMIMVDMLSFAMDHPPPATIVLVSGDRDFVYALAVLRNRRYNVVLVVPNKGATPVLRSQANVVLEWRYDILSQDVVSKFQAPPARVSTLARSTSQLLATGGTIESLLGNTAVPSGLSVGGGSIMSGAPTIPSAQHLSTGAPSNTMQSSSGGLHRSHSHSQLQNIAQIHFGSHQSLPKSASSSNLRVQVASTDADPDATDKPDIHPHNPLSDPLDEVPVYSPQAPGFFDVLVEILQSSKLVGINKPSKSRVVAELIARNPMLCQRAGVATVDDFLEAAVSAGLIRIGGLGPANQWITLKI